MEPKFINRYTMTKETLREFTWHGGRYILVFIIAGIAVLVGFVSFLEPYIKWGLLDNLPILIAAVLLAAWLVYGFFAMINRNWKRMTEQAGGESFVLTMTFSEDGGVIENSRTGSRLELDYAQVRRMLSTKNLIAVITEAKIAYVLRKDSFVLGDAEEFIKFIRAKIEMNKLK